MKKMLGIAAVAVAFAGLFVSCASTGAAKDDVKTKSSVPHPRTYVIDLADAKTGNVTKFSCPQGTYYGSSLNDFSDFLKYGWPEKGDTFEIHYKGVSDIDLPAFELCIGNHTTWNNLISQEQCELAFHENIKAGVPFEGVKTYIVDGTAPKDKAVVSFDFYYDNCLNAKDPATYPKVGKAATITWEKTGAVTTDTALESAVEIVGHPAEAVTFDIDIAECMKMIQFSVGDADENNNVANYKAFINVSEAACFKDYFPKAGDTVNFTFKGTSDSEIQTPVIYALVDQSEAAGWWLEVGAENWTQAMIEYVPEDEEFTASGSMTLAKDCIGGFTIFALYNSFEDSTGATWIYSRNK